MKNESLQLSIDLIASWLDDFAIGKATDEDFEKIKSLVNRLRSDKEVKNSEFPTLRINTSEDKNG